MNIRKKIGGPRKRNRPKMNPITRYNFWGERSTAASLEQEPVVRDKNGIGIRLDDLPLAVACWRANRGEKGVLERELALLGVAETINQPSEEIALYAMADKKEPLRGRIPTANPAVYRFAQFAIARLGDELTNELNAIIKQLVAEGKEAAGLERMAYLQLYYAPGRTPAEKETIAVSDPGVAQLLGLRVNNDQESESPTEEPKIYIEVLTTSEIKAYQPTPGVLLVGHNHIVRGSVFILAGPPGVGKSRATVALAEAGATGHEWFGLTVHCKFRTLIIQNENGRYRLKQEFAELDEQILDPYLRITPPPPFGLCFGKSGFRDQLKAQIETFPPECVL